MIRERLDAARQRAAAFARKAAARASEATLAFDGFGFDAEEARRRTRAVAVLLRPPQPPGGRPAVLQLALGIAALMAIVVASGVAVGAFGVLFLALGALYLLVTRVLGVELTFAPQAARPR